ncbi:MAG TPA: tripartite tricarboxylate transporter substrate-binding protein, partial [Candidatus Binataceae bacterium]|nr:tripartite tricarboxylate transporter substrate-binding protein [Candidatus Binataceae bacterium]
ELPALAQHGAPGFQFDLWWGFWGPPGMAPDLAARIAADIGKVVAAADMKEMFLREGADSAQMSPAEFAKTVASEIEQWRKVAAKANIKAE